MDFFEAVTLFVGKTVFLMVCIPNVHNGKILKGRKNGKTVEKTWWPQFFSFLDTPTTHPPLSELPKPSVLFISSFLYLQLLCSFYHYFFFLFLPSAIRCSKLKRVKVGHHQSSRKRGRKRLDTSTLSKGKMEKMWKWRRLLKRKAKIERMAKRDRELEGKLRQRK
jgi:hypothetical protein